MDAHREIKNTLTWHHEGKFSATLINGQITELNFCEPGTGPDEGCGKCLTSIDYKYLKAVHESLTELFAFIEQENEKMGYKFSKQ